jgi:hypothetical protein
VVSFCAPAAALPLTAFVYDHWGFDTSVPHPRRCGGGDPRRRCTAAAPAADIGGGGA